MHNYKSKLLYSAKNRNKRKDGRLRYYIENIKSPPADMAISNSGREQFQWCIHNLDIIAEKYNIIMIKNKPNSEDNRDGN